MWNDEKKLPEAEAPFLSINNRALHDTLDVLDRKFKVLQLEYPHDLLISTNNNQIVWNI